MFVLGLTKIELSVNSVKIDRAVKLDSISFIKNILSLEVKLGQYSSAHTDAKLLRRSLASDLKIQFPVQQLQICTSLLSVFDYLQNLRLLLLLAPVRNCLYGQLSGIQRHDLTKEVGVTSSPLIHYRFV